MNEGYITEIPGPLDHKRYQEPRPEKPTPPAGFTWKQRIMNRFHRRQEGHRSAHASPNILGRTGTPEHAIRWRTESDRDLVLRAIRLGVVRTGLGRQPWGPNGQFKTRKALFVAVTRAERAGTEETPDNVATAKALADRWAER